MYRAYELRALVNQRYLIPLAHMKVRLHLSVAHCYYTLCGIRLHCTAGLMLYRHSQLWTKSRREIYLILVLCFLPASGKMLCALYLEFSFFRKFFCYQLPGSSFFPVTLLQFGHNFDIMHFKGQLCPFFLTIEIHEKVTWGIVTDLKVWILLLVELKKPGSRSI